MLFAFYIVGAVTFYLTFLFFSNSLYLQFWVSHLCSVYVWILLELSGIECDWIMFWISSNLLPSVDMVKRVPCIIILIMKSNSYNTVSVTVFAVPFCSQCVKRWNLHARFFSILVKRTSLINNIFRWNNCFPYTWIILLTFGIMIIYVGQIISEFHVSFCMTFSLNMNNEYFQIITQWWLVNYCTYIICDRLVLEMAMRHCYMNFSIFVGK